MDDPRIKIMQIVDLVDVYVASTQEDLDTLSEAKATPAAFIRTANLFKQQLLNVVKNIEALSGGKDDARTKKP